MAGFRGWRMPGLDRRRWVTPMPEQEKRSDGPDSIWNSVGQHAGWGLTIAGSIGLFLFLGYQLDQRLGTMPILTILGALGGAAGGFYSMFRRLVSGSAEPKDEEGDDPGRTG